MQKFVIVGGDAAGMSAAMQIVRRLPDASVVALEMGDTFSYAQCGLPYYIGGDIPETDNLIARSAETFRNKYGIDARTYHKVTKIHPSEKTVDFINMQSGEAGTVPYDRLLIATGARPVVPEWEGIDLQGVFVLKTIRDAERIREYVRNGEVNKCVIIGGGPIGIEMAEALSASEKKVTILDRNPQLATAWNSEIAEIAKQHMEENGVLVKPEQNVKGIVGQNGKAAAVETESETLEADLVLLAVGVAPNSELAKDAGVQLGVRNAIQVNARMETNLPGIYAAGDVAVHYHRVKKKDDYIPLGTTANKQGRIAGINMSGEQAAFAGIVGSAVMKVFELGLARTGLSRKEAEDLGMEVEVVTINTKDHAGYYPNAEDLSIQLIVEKSAGQLVGGQAAGKSGADKRVDVLATALYHELTVHELLDLDLTYAPPFNGVWDPIQQAARRF
ncbi:FAD-dependent oxidoreductase [Effusibacillus consociatus]|uniref:FAD-dependent oxidoreductase n=1 Tax=Effusibacillus consociatus TaxID=1117041 RepID=A0ABV9PZA3_9BACL